MKNPLNLLRRATSWVAMVWHDIEVECIANAIPHAETPHELLRLERRLREQKAKRTAARGAYISTLPPGQRCIWIDA